MTSKLELELELELGGDAGAASPGLEPVPFTKLLSTLTRTTESTPFERGTARTPALRSSGHRSSETGAAPNYPTAGTTRQATFPEATPTRHRSCADFAPKSAVTDHSGERQQTSGPEVGSGV